MPRKKNRKMKKIKKLNYGHVTEETLLTVETKSKPR